MCDHTEFRASVKVSRFTREEQTALDLGVDVAVHCMDCEEPVHFLGMPGGVDFKHPTMSVDRREARLPAIISGGPR